MVESVECFACWSRRTVLSCLVFLASFVCLSWVDMDEAWALPPPPATHAVSDAAPVALSSRVAISHYTAGRWVPGN